MSTGQSDYGPETEAVEGLSPEVDARLSQILERWAAAHRLTTAQADLVRQAIVSQGDQTRSGELGYAYWDSLMFGVATMLDQAMHGLGAALSVPVAPAALGIPQSPRARRGRADHSRGFRPYLRLA